MDGPGVPKDGESQLSLTHQLEVKRVRLLAAIALLGGIGLLIALPFALRAGAEFFLPLTAALVTAVALVPLLEWFEKQGLPSWLSALISLILFFAGMTFAIAAIVFPAFDWVALIPERIERLRTTIAPLLDLYAALDRYLETLLSQIANTMPQGQTIRLETANSMLDLIATSAPHAAIQLFFAMLVVFFFLARWTAMRERTIVSRGSFQGAITTARVIQQVVAATSTYIATIALVNLILGTLVALILWMIGMDTPIMWGGIVAVLNFIPYLGPILSALLLGIGGLMTYPDAWTAMLPPLIFIGLHLVEANVITPLIVGKRVQISPLWILISLSFWTWVWGTLGAILAIPLLIIIRTIFSAAGTPDIAGFLFEDGTLTHVGEEDEKDE